MRALRKNCVVVTREERGSSRPPRTLWRTPTKLRVTVLKGNLSLKGQTRYFLFN